MLSVTAAVMAGRPNLPIGLQLTRSSKVVSRAFEDALAGAGGSVPMWLVLLSLKTQQLANQRRLADAVGVQEATLSYHLNAMAEQGLLTRERDPANRRVHQVALTESGEAAFLRLRGAVVAFDKRLRAGISDEQVEVLRQILNLLTDNAPKATQKIPSCASTTR
jgi:MarR family transcriptional regulator for hemolysin